MLDEVGMRRGETCLSIPNLSSGIRGASDVEGSRRMRCPRLLSLIFAAAYSRFFESMSVAMKRHRGRVAHARRG